MERNIHHSVLRSSKPVIGRVAFAQHSALTYAALRNRLAAHLKASIELLERDDEDSDIRWKLRGVDLGISHQAPSHNLKVQVSWPDRLYYLTVNFCMGIPPYVGVDSTVKPWEAVTADHPRVQHDWVINLVAEAGECRSTVRSLIESYQTPFIRRRRDESDSAFTDRFTVRARESVLALIRWAEEELDAAYDVYVFQVTEGVD